MMVAGIGSRKGISTDEVIAAVDAALAHHGLVIADLSALATTDFKRDESGIFRAAERLGLPMIVVETAAPISDEDGATSPTPSPRGELSGRRSTGAATLTRSRISQAVAGVPSVSETAALAAAGRGGRLLVPRLVVGRVTCAIAIREDRP